MASKVNVYINENDYFTIGTSQGLSNSFHDDPDKNRNNSYLPKHDPKIKLR